jgi:eukaryotic-like serine/threonine-protein kinase
MKPGDLLAGRFVLEALAGTGGMGEIYRAKDLERRQDVAVKLLRDSHGTEEARFQREARLLEELVHPRIVRYVAHGSSPLGEPYLVMEWLEGEDLSRTLARGRLGVEQSVQIARGAAEALGAAHARGIVHRDLKPSNIFLEQASPRQVKLLDFGIALPGAGTRITHTGTLLGTPGYMAWASWTRGRTSSRSAACSSSVSLASLRSTGTS